MEYLFCVAMIVAIILIIKERRAHLFHLGKRIEQENKYKDTAALLYSEGFLRRTDSLAEDFRQLILTTSIIECTKRCSGGKKVVLIQDIPEIDYRVGDKASFIPKTVKTSSGVDRG